MIRKSFLAISLIGFFGINCALAEGYPSKEENAKNLKEGIEHAEAGLAAAQEGHADGCADHVKAARESLKEINASDAIAAVLRKGRTPLQSAWAKCKKGNSEAAVPLIEESIAALKKVQK